MPEFRWNAILLVPSNNALISTETRTPKPSGISESSGFKYEVCHIVSCSHAVSSVSTDVVYKIGIESTRDLSQIAFSVKICIIDCESYSLLDVRQNFGEIHQVVWELLKTDQKYVFVKAEKKKTIPINDSIFYIFPLKNVCKNQRKQLTRAMRFQWLPFDTRLMNLRG